MWQWDAVSGAVGYQVQISIGDRDFSPPDEQALLPASQTAARFADENLAPGTAVYLRVRAFAGTPEEPVVSAFSAAVGGMTASASPAPLGAVTGLTVTPAANALELSWDAVRGADGYRVQWKSGTENFDSSREATVVGGGATQHTISGLTAGASYTVQVAATRAGQPDGPWSVEVAGVPTPAPLGAVQGLTVTPAPYALELSWDAVTDANGYKVQWKSSAQNYDSSREATVVGGATTQHTIIGLPLVLSGQALTYRVRVAATNAGQPDGPWSAERSSALALGQVTGLMVTSAVNALQLSWSAVREATGYRVQWKSGNQQYDLRSVARGGRTIFHSGFRSGTQASIPDLVPGTVYTVRVGADFNGWMPQGTPWSEEVRATPRSP